MRLSILGFNQAKIVELGLTTDDVLLLQYIMYAHSEPTMKHIVDNEISYVWLQHSKIQEDLPILNISEGTLKNKLSSFRKLGLIDSKTIANNIGRGSRTYYTITEMTTSLQNDAVSRPRHSRMTSNNLLTNDIELKEVTPISKDIVVGEFEDDISSKLYSANDFLGSSKKKEKPKKKSLYSKCVDEIDQFTQNLELRTILVAYLNFRLAVKDKPIYGVAQWKALLSKLRKISSESGDKEVDIAQQSLDKSWLSFYPIKSFSDKKNVFSEYGEVSCEKREDEVYVDRVF